MITYFEKVLPSCYFSMVNFEKSCFHCFDQLYALMLNFSATLGGTSMVVYSFTPFFSNQFQEA